jgi:hypothetical protein
VVVVFLLLLCKVLLCKVKLVLVVCLFILPIVHPLRMFNLLNQLMNLILKLLHKSILLLVPPISLQVQLPQLLHLILEIHVRL